jgi:hypothetical protein
MREEYLFVGIVFSHSRGIKEDDDLDSIEM